jgi:tRNA threonylcarbamoyladenosine biosynthesis protein TsaB
MVKILSLECSTERSSVNISFDGKSIASVCIDTPNAASTLLHVAMEQVLALAGIVVSNLSAVVVSSGPGSYTGLRIGAAAAKGLCFAHSIPLVAVSALEALAAEAKALLDWPYLICPMLDARRNEVYLAVYGQGMEVVQAPEPVIYGDGFLASVWQGRPMLFCGNGMPKLKQSLSNNPNAYFIHTLHPDAEWLGKVGYQKFLNQQFENVAAFEPDYLKLFDRKL